MVELSAIGVVGRCFSMFVVFGLLLFGTGSMAEEVVFNAEKTSQEITFPEKLQFTVVQGTPAGSFVIKLETFVELLTSKFGDSITTMTEKIKDAPNQMIIGGSLVFDGKKVGGRRGEEPCDANFKAVQVDGKDVSQALVSLNGTLPSGLTLTAVNAAVAVPAAVGGANVGKIVGICIAVVVLIALVVGGIVGFLMWKKKQAKKEGGPPSGSKADKKKAKLADGSQKPGAETPATDKPAV